MRIMLSTALVAFALGCSSPEPDPSARVDASGLARGPEWKPVALAVVARCGSLDCHGSKYRNMRLYGYGGLRLDPNHLPSQQVPAGSFMTDAEADANYQAIVGVEPEIIRQVVADGGRGSERLTFVRKARGEEAHKGGARIARGDPADVCVQSWFAGAIATDACVEVAKELTGQP